MTGIKQNANAHILITWEMQDWTCCCTMATFTQTVFTQSDSTWISKMPTKSLCPLMFCWFYGDMSYIQSCQGIWHLKYFNEEWNRRKRQATTAVLPCQCINLGRDCRMSIALKGHYTSRSCILSCFTVLNIWNQTIIVNISFVDILL